MPVTTWWSNGGEKLNLKICTYNLRMENPDDGINVFSNRAPFIKERLAEYAPDVIGFQEVRPHMRRWLEENLPDYTIIGTGRGEDFLDESNVIAYRTDKFLTMALDTFWLSDTPYVPGSRYSTDQSDCPRICTCAVLLLRDTTKRLRVYNTHLDHVGNVARVQGIEAILGRIAMDEQRYPGTQLVLMGDFNAEPDHMVMRAIAMEADNLVDTTRSIPYTFHNYEPEKMQAKIDYIFTNGPWIEESTVAFTDCRDGVYLSDHYPVMTEIIL